MKKWPLDDISIQFPHIFLIHSLAGSGKTENLAGRYIQFILSDKIPKNSISNILAITFTENSAKDMKNRIIKVLKGIALGDKKIHERIKRYVQKEEDWLKEKASSKIEEIIDNYSFFNISTIDAFVLKIFEAAVMKLNYPVDWDLSFDYSEVIDGAFSYFIYNAFKNPEVLNEIDNAVDLIDRTEKRFLINPLGNIKENFRKFLEKEDALICDVKNADEKIVKEKKKIEQEIFKSIKNLVSGKNEALTYNDIVDGYKQKNIFMIANKIVEKGKIFKVLNDKIDEKSVIKSDALVKLSMKYLILDSITFYYPYVLVYKIFKKNSESYITKNASCIVLSRITRDVSKYLKDADDERIIDVYIRLSSFIRHFLIDEFQDTSYSQWSIIRPLIEESVSSNGSGFFIGDIKQAIYMFRNADYRIIDEFIKKPKKENNNNYINLGSLEKGIEKFDIDINYRSSKAILDYVNEFFNSEKFKEFLLNSGLKDFIGNYAIEHKAHKESIGHFKTIVIKKEKDEESNIEENIKSVFLKALKNMVSKFGYSGIGVLTYKNDNVEKIVGWINEIGYPVVSYSSLDVRKNKIISGIISFLKFIENPSNNLSLYEFLVSGILVDITNSEIEKIFLKSKTDKTLYEVLKKEYKGFKDNIEYFIERSGYLSVYELVNDMYRKFDLYKRFKEHHAFLLKFLELVFDKTIYKKPGSLPSFVAEVLNENLEDESFSIEMSEFLGAIKVMTFHKAKGLQFDAVINLFWKGKTGWDDLMYFTYSEDDVEILKINKILGKSALGIKENIIGRVYKEEEIKENISDINEVYVALTRAKEDLFNIVVKPAEKGILRVFEEAEGGKLEKMALNSPKMENINIEGLTSKNITHPFIKKPDFENEVELRGKIYHRVLSMINYTNELDNIDDFILKSFSIEGISYDISFFDEIKKKILNIFENQSFREFFEKRKNRRVIIEREFVSANGEILRPDRVIIDEKISVIDFKTGEFKTEYIEQIKKYVDVISCLFLKKGTGYLCYIDKNIVEKIYEKN